MMLDKIFLEVLNMSFNASFVIVFVLIARLLLKKAPKIFSYAMWAVVLFRLVCPMSFESLWSLLPVQSNPISSDIVYAQNPQIYTGLTALDNALNPLLPAGTPYATTNPLQIWLFGGKILWIVGIVIIGIYSIFSLVGLHRKLIGAVRIHDNIFLADHIATPFVIGLLRPKIYLPSSLTDKEQAYIILHEQTHIRRLDHLVKIAAFAALAIHWFNPLVWMAFILAVKDMEMSCDEAVMQKMGGDIRAEYSASLLSLATGKKILAGAPLAFGEGDTKSRIKNVLNYKKPSFWVAVLAFILVIALGAILLMNPKKPVSNAVPPQSIGLQFPAYQDGKTELNTTIYEIEPFILSIALPDGWEAKLPATTERESNVGFTPVYLFNGETHVGTIFYNTFALYEGNDVPPGDFYKTVYPELRLGSLYQWQDYMPVATTDVAETATATVYIKKEVVGQSAAAWPTLEVPGILSYNKDLLVYIGIQFEEDTVTDEQLVSIAESIHISAA